MYWFGVPILIGVADAFVASSARPISLNDTSELSLETTALSLLDSSSNLLASNLSDGITFKCNGTAFRYGLSAQSCINALLSYPSVLDWDSPVPKTWGPRGTDVRYDFRLPVRFISSESKTPHFLNVVDVVTDSCSSGWILHH